MFIDFKWTDGRGRDLEHCQVVTADRQVDPIGRPLRSSLLFDHLVVSSRSRQLRQVRKMTVHAYTGTAVCMLAFGQF